MTFQTKWKRFSLRHKTNGSPLLRKEFLTDLLCEKYEYVLCQCQNNTTTNFIIYRILLNNGTAKHKEYNDFEHTAERFNTLVPLSLKCSRLLHLKEFLHTLAAGKKKNPY